MLELTAEQFAQRAFDLNLVDSRQLESVWSQLGTHSVPAADFLKVLVRRELLTNFQVERLLKGEKTGFFYGDYKVLYLVGTGSFARVYRAVHKDTSNVVAIKVLRKRYAEDVMELQRFLREGRMGIQLRHPNIVPIYEVHSVRREHFLVMAFVEGQSLREFVRLRRKVAPLEATEILAGVMSGLAYAANKGITHRDLKLSNVLISSSGQPQLVDFGLAGGADGDRSASTARSIDYAGLEKLTGVSKDDPRSDIYFAGCMYYHLLTGKPPLTESKDKIQRMNMSRFREVTSIRTLEPEIPALIENIVEKSMQLSVADRYARPVDMSVDLQRAMDALRAAAKQGDASGSSLSLSMQRGSYVLLVEAHQPVQDALRIALKKHDYQVLVMEDPERAWQRIMASPESVGCAVVSTGSLGKTALHLYKNLRTYPRTAEIPTILLLGKSHEALRARLKLPTESHRALSMPVRVSELVQELKSVFRETSQSAQAS
ncbi:MAG TPA: protein kinase [Pirellulaceae bacterium]